MGPIIPAHQPRQNYAKMIGDQLSEGMKNYFQQQKTADALKQENEALENLGIHATGVNDPKIRQLLAASSLKGEKVDTKGIQRENELEGASQTLQRMKDIRKQGNLGWGSSISRLWSPETRRHAGEYEQLGKSLISFATNIKITNRREFEEYAKKLSDPSISDDEAEGILSAMERIISNSQKSISGKPNKDKKDERQALDTWAEF